MAKHGFSFPIQIPSDLSQDQLIRKELQKSCEMLREPGDSIALCSQRPSQLILPTLKGGVRSLERRNPETMFADWMAVDYNNNIIAWKPFRLSGVSPVSASSKAVGEPKHVVGEPNTISFTNARSTSASVPQGLQITCGTEASSSGSKTKKKKSKSQKKQLRKLKTTVAAVAFGSVGKPNTGTDLLPSIPAKKSKQKPDLTSGSTGAVTMDGILRKDEPLTSSWVGENRYMLVFDPVRLIVDRRKFPLSNEPTVSEICNALRKTGHQFDLKGGKIINVRVAGANEGIRPVPRATSPCVLATSSTPKSASAKKLQNQSAPSSAETTTGPKFPKGNCPSPPAVASRKKSIKMEKRLGLADGSYEEGMLVVSPKSFDQAYVRVFGKDNQDVNICGQIARNRAFPGDSVVVEIFPRQQWKVRPECMDELQSALGIAALGSAVSNVAIADLIHNNQKEKKSPMSPLSETIRGALLMRESLSGVEDPGEFGCSEANMPDSHEGTNLIGGSSESKKGDLNGDFKLDAKKNTPANTASSRKQGRKWMDIAVEHLGLDGVPDRWLQKTGKVVYISEAKGCRKAVGCLTPTQNKTAFVLEPIDQRLPKMLVPPNVVKGFKDQQSGFMEDKSNGTLMYLGEVTDWKPDQHLPAGRVIKHIGVSGAIESATVGILVENGIDEAEFPSAELQDLMKTLPKQITPQEVECRKDFRGQCVFTIDPPDAKDLDDAVSCSRLGNGIFEIGVHIADVSLVVPEGSALDLYARNRATSVYLVNKVVHMLPPKLIETYCSLDPGKDRRTISAMFHLTEDGEILDYHITRSIIRSCAKLSYQHAQEVIDDPAGTWNGSAIKKSTLTSIKRTIVDLAGLTQALRRCRFEKGGLRIDQPEFRFELSAEGMPIAMHLRETWKSCQLIEELALLTNMTVAQIIHRNFSDIALLRRHLPPLDSPLRGMQKFCELENLCMDIEGAKQIQLSMNEIGQSRPEMLPVLSYLCAKPMKLADYVCAGMHDDTSHYALGVDQYTHMTSPIRRYPDIIVHRLLAASLGYGERPAVDLAAMDEIVKSCNEKRMAARRCQENSWDLFMGLYISLCGPLLEEAVVVAVYGPTLSVDVLVTRLAITQRVFCAKNTGVKSVNHRVVGFRQILDLTWHKDVVQSLSGWTSVNVLLTSEKEDPRNIKITLVRPK